MSSKMIAAAFGFALVAMTAACSNAVEGTDDKGEGSPFGNLGGDKKKEETSSSGGSSSGSSGTPALGGGSSSSSSSSSSGSSGSPTGCSAGEGASACGTCAAKSCCNELMACQNNQQCGSLNTCVTQCGQDESCSQQCLQQYPQGREPLLGVYQCLNSKCSSQCNG